MIKFLEVIASYLTPTLAESDITEAGGPYKTFSSHNIIICHKIIKIQPLIRKFFFKARIFFFTETTRQRESQLSNILNPKPDMGHF